MSPKSRREVTLLTAAKSDIGRPNDDDPAIAKLALRTIQDLQEGNVTGEPLGDMPKSGDLADCRKLKFGVGDPPSHRSGLAVTGARRRGWRVTGP